ncbi:MAG: GUN4 domain-containing protein [Bacteroidota bacterium]
MIRIFLAHASEDKAAVIELYNHFKENGFQPWLDKVDLLPGQNWQAEISKAIKNSHVFIACLSQNSVQKRGYIQREFRMALNAMADQPPGQIYLIPVRLDDCQIPKLRQEEYGISLRDYQWVDLFEPSGYEHLLRGIEAGFADVLDKPETIIPSSRTESVSTNKPVLLEPEIPEKSQSDVDNLSSEKEIDYTVLETLLKAKKWKQANQETYKVMSQALNGSWSFKNLCNFPCTDLRVIDQLWTKHSEDRFGFSVQKEIWQSHGSPRTYNDKWKQFCVTVRWRKEGVFGMGGNWIDSSQASFSLSAPKGHLPFYKDVEYWNKTVFDWWKLKHYDTADQFGQYYAGSIIPIGQRKETRPSASMAAALFSRVKTCNL